MYEIAGLREQYRDIRLEYDAPKERNEDRGEPKQEPKPEKDGAQETIRERHVPETV